MTNTEYLIDGKNVSYEVTDDDYTIYLNGTPWIKQDAKGYIPFPQDTLEASCVAHIESIASTTEEPVETPASSTEVESLAVAVDDLGSTIDTQGVDIESIKASLSDVTSALEDIAAMIAVE